MYLFYTYKFYMYSLAFPNFCNVKIKLKQRNQDRISEKS